METRQFVSYISLIFFSALFLFLFVWPKYNQFLEEKKEVLTLENDLQSYKEYFKEIEEIFSKVKERKEEVEKIKTALPSTPYTPETFNFLQVSAFESGLLLKDIAFSIEEPPQIISEEGEVVQVEQEKIREVKISLSLSGRYESLKNFLKKIENSSRLIELESLSFSGKEPFDFKLDLKTFYLPK